MRHWLLLMLLVAPALIQLSSRDGSLLAMAEEDEVEEDGVVEDEDAADKASDDDDASSAGSDEKKNVSPDADTTLVFTRPSAAPGGSVELPAGHVVEFLVGFANRGKSDFVVETLDASFRYPMDFTFHIQNFSAIAYQKTVRPDEEATIAYSFIPADAFAGRPIGLTVNLAYRDTEGNFFFDPVFNETVQIVEFAEGFDTEVFFMYVLLVGVAVLAVFLVYNFAGGKAKGGKGHHHGSAAKPVETGTANDDVDYEWIPRSALQQQRTPGSGKTSPRQRGGKNKSGKNASSDTE